MSVLRKLSNRVLTWARYGALVLMLSGCAGGPVRGPTATVCPACHPDSEVVAAPLPRAEPGAAEVRP